MAATETPTPESERASWRLRLQRLRLRFSDPDLESAFQADRFRHNLGNNRFAFIAGAALWVVWGLLLRPHILVLHELRLDTVMRFGVFIPILVIGFALSFWRSFERIWEWVAAVIAAATLLLWVYYVSQVVTLPPEYGYVGITLITAFTYTLLRLRFVWVLLITVVGIAAYLAFAFSASSIIYAASRTLAVLYLVSFGFLGALAAYRMERFTRELFLRERQVDRERSRSDRLLVNTFPEAIIEQLKTASGGRIAERLDQVSVMFVDAVGSTAQAARSTPEAFTDALDDLFSRFDRLVERHGLEKIKTIGDAYVAVAGAPIPVEDHAQAAAAMALDVLAESAQARWPSGDPIVVRVGVATGPAVAGVIGELRFAYDLWGDTVNLANRLEQSAPHGGVLVSESTAIASADGFDFGPPRTLDLKGKGPTSVRLLLGRSSNGPVAGSPLVPRAERPAGGSSL
jgi:class 3 adenylate cyclase